MDTKIDERSWLERTLTADIPLGGAMKLGVTRLDDEGVELSLPLSPNVNDKGTAFGGALASAMILAGWALPRLLLKRAAIRAELVIGRCETRFLAPVRGDFRALCAWPPVSDGRRFAERVEEKGRASVLLEPRIETADGVAATLVAKYAALRG